MSADLAPLTGTVVAVPQSVRQVDPRAWDEESARSAAVEFWLQSVKSQHSKDAYRRDIGLWFAWCNENDIPVDDARRADVDGWRESMTAAPATIARRLSAVSSFYRYWVAEDIVARNPAQNAARPAVSPEPSSISLSRQQSAALLAYLNDLSDQRPGVIFRLLAETGMRISELTGAGVTDLAMSGGHHVLTIIRKGGKAQMLPIAGGTYARVTDYLAGRTAGYILEVKRTDRRKGDGRMDRSYVRQLLRRVAREAGLPPEVHEHMHPHVLRHSAATLLAADGVPPHEIQMLLGHADLRTTQRYIHHAESLDASPVYRLAQLLAR
jgi:integrase/recombinase XerD